MSVTEQSTENIPEAAPRHGVHTALASIAAIGSVLAASICCLPVLPFLFAAGAAGTSAFVAAARPYLLGASILFIVYGFFQAWRAKRCHRKTSAISGLLLLTSTVFVVIAIFFPQILANAVANWSAR